MNSDLKGETIFTVDKRHRLGSAGRTDGLMTSHGPRRDRTNKHLCLGHGKCVLWHVSTHCNFFITFNETQQDHTKEMVAYWHRGGNVISLLFPSQVLIEEGAANDFSNEQK